MQFYNSSRQWAANYSPLPLGGEGSLLILNTSTPRAACGRHHWAHRGHPVGSKASRLCPKYGGHGGPSTQTQNSILKT